MKRFWKDVALNDTAGGWSIALDERPLKTPARETLVVGSRPLGEAIADEWRACGEEIDPRAMPLTGLANAAIDHVAPAPERFAADLAQYAEGDLLCYRAEHPPKLVAAQAAAWDPLLDWARQRFDAEFVVTAGIVHVPQPAETIARLTQRASRAARSRSRPCPRSSPSAARSSLRWHCTSARSTSTRRGRRCRSTIAGRSSNGAPTTKPLRRSPIASSDFAAAARFLDLLARAARPVRERTRRDRAGGCA